MSTLFLVLCAAMLGLAMATIVMGALSSLEHKATRFPHDKLPRASVFVYRMLAVVLNRDAVVMLDFDNSVKFSLCGYHNDVLYAPVFLFPRAGEVVLDPRGVVSQKHRRI